MLSQRNCKWSQSHSFFFQKILNCSLQNELPAHSYQDLILTNEPYKGIMFSAVLLNSYWIECFHMTPRRPYWCPKTMKWRPCWCPKPILWELNSFLMQTLSFVPINLHRCCPSEWKHSIRLSIACSQTFCFLFKVRQARLIKKNARDLLTAGGRGHLFFFLPSWPMFSKRTKRKTKFS